MRLEGEFLFPIMRLHIVSGDESSCSEKHVGYPPKFPIMRLHIVSGDAMILLIIHLHTWFAQF